MKNRKVFISLCLVIVTGAAAAWWVLITSDSPLTSLHRCQFFDADARLVIGLYPAERDCRVLTQHSAGLFEAFQSQNRDNAQAPIGLGHCADRENDPAAAEVRILSALRQVPDNQELRDVLERARTSP